MTFQTLKKIAEKYITYNSTEFPADAFKLAKELNLRVKNSIECKQDFKDKYPLYNCNAAYTLVNGEYTIYHDEKYAYKNFSVAHEIAHHLLEHCSDGIREHHDANLLAAILLLSPEEIVKNKIKNPVELSEQCLIPYNVACEYWSEIKNFIQPVHRFKIRIRYLVLVITLVMAIIIIICYNIQNSNRQGNSIQISYPSPSPITAPTTNTIPDDSLYYITSSGTHYHLKDCKYVKYKNNIIDISKDEIIKLNLEPCNECIK